jgi:cytochrome c oxidase subunit 3
MSDHAAHHPFQAHHFDDMEQQFDAGKLGMWLFLATEVLFFSGMFVAYTVYRVHHPEVFASAHHYLDKWLGGFNTVVLLASSLSVAWGVRCAQLDNRKGLVGCLLFTLSCAGLFMGVKAVEYTLKFYEGIFWASDYAPPAAGTHPDLTDAYSTLNYMAIATAAVGLLLVGIGFASGLAQKMRGWVLLAIGLTIASVALGIGSARGIQAIQEPLGLVSHDESHSDAHGHEGEHHEGEHHSDDHADTVSSPVATPVVLQSDAPLDEELTPFAGDEVQVPMADPVDAERIELAQRESNSRQYEGIFFSIYYAMTGVHALHILGGIGVIVWITGRAALGQFGHSYYGPVEYVGLYWHLVDLIWIFLFPLLYLIREPVLS